MIDRRRARWFVAGVVLVAVLLSGCGVRLARDVPPPTLDEVAEAAHLVFPDGSVLVASTYEGFQDWRVTAIVTFPADELDGFWADNGLDAEPGLRALTNTHASDLPEWTPDAASAVVGYDGRGEPLSGVYRSVVADVDDPATTRLYVEAFTT